MIENNNRFHLKHMYVHVDQAKHCSDKSLSLSWQQFIIKWNDNGAVHRQNEYVVDSCLQTESHYLNHCLLIVWSISYGIGGTNAIGIYH